MCFFFLFFVISALLSLHLSISLSLLLWMSHKSNASFSNDRITPSCVWITWFASEKWRKQNRLPTLSSTLPHLPTSYLPDWDRAGPCCCRPMETMGEESSYLRRPRTWSGKTKSLSAGSIGHQYDSPDSLQIHALIPAAPDRSVSLNPTCLPISEIEELRRK